MNTTVRRLLLSATLVLAALWALAGAKAEEKYPSKPVRIIVSFSAGGPTDIVARVVGAKMGDLLGQQFVVENRVGAGGNIGADQVAKSPPDGYTLLMTSGSIVTVNQHMYKTMTYDPAKDLAPITNVASGPQVIAVSADVPAKDLREFIAYAKANPKKVNMGSAGMGTQTHLAAENFALSAGIDITHIPYKGESAALTDLMGGQIQLVTPNLGASVSLIQQGRLRALAVTSPQRSPQLPDVPAVAEVIPGFENTGWFGLMAPAGTPREVIDRVQRDSAKILTSEEFRGKLAQQGMVPVANTPSEFAAAIRSESTRWAQVVKERGLTAN
jgi:tripartite-type tricarboxylate transporter receptor subunit TctC